jgi:hypothetical protein
MGIAARDHHAGATGQRQPVTGLPVQDGLTAWLVSRPEASIRLTP